MAVFWFGWAKKLKNVFTKKQADGLYLPKSFEATINEVKRLTTLITIKSNSTMPGNGNLIFTFTPRIDNTIIVVDISRIKHIIQIDENATQGFAANLTEYLAKHVWGVIDIMPWCKKIVYKNTNLRMIPTQVVSE